MLATRPHHTPRPLATWLVALALLWGALWPALAQAMASRSQNSQWVEVCQATGVTWVKVDATGVGDTAPPASNHPLTNSAPHCGWCPALGTAVVMPPTPLLWLAAHGTEARPTPTLAHPHPHTRWVAVQARAPPPQVS